LGRKGVALAFITRRGYRQRDSTASSTVRYQQHDRLSGITLMAPPPTENGGRARTDQRRQGAPGRRRRLSAVRAQLGVHLVTQLGLILAEVARALGVSTSQQVPPHPGPAHGPQTSRGLTFSSACGIGTRMMWRSSRRSCILHEPKNGKPRPKPYTFKCPAPGSGTDSTPDLRGASTDHLTATPIDLLTAGADVPCARNSSTSVLPSPLYQRSARGTRLDAPTTTRCHPALG
jgi:hypothetical protein